MTIQEFQNLRWEDKDIYLDAIGVTDGKERYCIYWFLNSLNKPKYDVWRDDKPTHDSRGKVRISNPLPNTVIADGVMVSTNEITDNLLLRLGNR